MIVNAILKSCILTHRFDVYLPIAKNVYTSYKALYRIMANICAYDKPRKHFNGNHSLKAINI